MSMHDRAAQFAPFAALTGCEAAVGETARQTDERRELDPQETGGAYVTVTGRVRHISVPEKTLFMEDALDNIVSMASEVF